MQRKTTFFPIFFIFLLLTIIVLLFSTLGMFRGVGGFFENTTLPLQKFTFGILSPSDKSTENKLWEENLKLIRELVKQKEIEKENKALHDQFAISNPSPKQLLPAKIIGRHGDEIIIDRGEREGIKVGQVVVFKDHIIGVVSHTSIYRTVVKFLTSDKTSFTAKTVKTEASGVINGGGGDEIIFDKVLLSEKLENDDIVIAKGDIDENGRGYPPGLVVGKIISINKKASNLFQSAEVASLIDFSKLETVFILVK